jgi:oligopeptidase B
VSEHEVPGPPPARREPVVRELHGSRRVDDYAWLRDLTAPEVLGHLAAERAWHDAATSHLHSQVETLVAEMASRVPPADRSVSWQRMRCSYYTSTSAGSEYAQLLRVCGPRNAFRTEDSVANPDFLDEISGQPQLLLDPVELAGDSSFLELGVCLVSPDENLLAYSVDLSGDEIFTLAFRDLDRLADTPDRVGRIAAGGAWSADSTTFFYPVPDAANRTAQVWRHRMGTPPGSDELVLEETDTRFSLQVRCTRSGDWVVIDSASYETSEVWLVDAHEPAVPARCVQPRRQGVTYRVEHARTPDGDALVVLTNDGATEFRLLLAPWERGGAGDPEAWSELVGENPAERLHSVDAFSSHLVVSLRRDGAPLLRVLDLDGSPAHDVSCSFPAGNIRLGRNEVFDADAVTVVEESFVQPPVWTDVHLRTGQRTERHRQEVPGYDAADYVTQRVQVPVGGDREPDALLVPATLVRHRGTPLDGTAPAVVWGYGAYESCDDPLFQVALPSLLDCGVVYVQTHPRGGGENGRWWWLDGRLAAKQHTFDDHVAVVDHLVAEGWIDGGRVATRGLSAGGMLQGAVFSQRPDRWRAVVAEVPFVDVVTTMLDPSIPLTAEEWDEWGDPRRRDDFFWMLAYSPYDNLPPAGTRPDLLVTGALHDARVMVWEPAKWVAALRATDPTWSPRCLFRVELGAGAHGGPSGRYAELRYEAEVYAWMLDRLALSVGAG